MRPVLGASLLAAAASLPLHLMPFLVAALAAQGRLPLWQVGWVASAYMAGQLASTIMLPAFGAWRLRWRWAALSAAVLMAGPWISLAGGPRGLVAGWFAVGAACGLLQFLAATTAARAPDPAAAFALRLSSVLMVSSIVIALLALGFVLADYGALARHMAGALLVLTAAGLLLYRAPQAPPPESPDAAGRPAGLVGLVVLFVLFVGQQGFWAYAVQGAQQRGLPLQEVALAVAACKAAAAVLLMLQQHTVHHLPRALLWPALAVAVGVLVMTGARNLGPFTVGLLLWELGLNPLSVRLHAAVVQVGGSAVGPWLAAAALTGAALGPALHGLAIQAQVQGAFVALACVSALLPCVWGAAQAMLPAAGLRR